MKTRAWLSFWILGVIWGASFLLIRIGVEDTHGDFIESQDVEKLWQPIQCVFVHGSFLF